MPCTSYLVLFCYALAFSPALALPQATPLPQKRGIGNSTVRANTLANATAHGLGNSTTSESKFGIKAEAGGGTITMDLGPLSVFTVFTQTTTSLATPTGIGYIIYPTDYDPLQEIPADGIRVVFGEETQRDLLAKFEDECDLVNPSDPGCIESLAEILDQQAPDLQKRFLPAIPLIAAALVAGVLEELYLDSLPRPTPVPQIHYVSSVMTSVAAVASATGASVFIVETATDDKHAIIISTTELTLFNPSPTASASSAGTALLTSDSSNHFVFQIQSTDMPALQSAETATATASSAPACTNGTSPLIERGDTDVYEETLCLADELMYNADGLMNPNGLISTFRTQIVEIAGQLVPDFNPIFQDLRVAGAFALFLAASDTLLPILFPGLHQAGWLVAAFIAFGLTMLPFASNTQGKLRTESGITQIVLQVTKGKSNSQPICPPSEQPYDCASVLCAGNAHNICTGPWLDTCPCVTCPSGQDMPSCDDCNSANPTTGKCATVNPGCSCYVDTTQNSNFQDLAFNLHALQIWNSLPSWSSSTSFPYMLGVTCRPDNSWYSSCQYPNTRTGSAFGANLDFERCLKSFSAPGTNPTMPTDLMMGPGSLNVTMICPTNKNTVDFVINVAYAPGCISRAYSGKSNISDPVGDGSINGLDVLRGNYYGCLNMIASYDPNAKAIDMVPGSAGQGYKVPSLPAPGNLYPGASNSGVGGWNQIGCLIYDVIPSRNRPTISVNAGSSDSSFKAANWDQYQKDWPTLANTYYENGGYYCKQPPARYRNAPPPCEAFPCPLGNSNQPTGSKVKAALR